MNGNGALRVLDALLDGKSTGITEEELAELEGHGLVVGVDARAERRAALFLDLATRHKVGSLEKVEAALADVEGKLASDLHWLTSFESTIQQLERDRSDLRRLIGLYRDPDALAQLKLGVTAREQAGARAAFVDTPGDRRHAVTELGWRARPALRVRLGRYGEADIGQFVKRFAKADRGMAQLATDYGQLAQQIGRPKGAEAVATGLLKSGLPPAEAIERYRAAIPTVGRLRTAVEVPHAAAAVVQGSVAAGVAGAEQRLHTIHGALLGRQLPNGPVLRGAMKALAASALEPAEAAARFDALFRGVPTRHGPDARIRTAARLFGAVGEPTAVLVRLATAEAATQRLPVAAALAAGATDPADLAARIEKWRQIEAELLRRGAFATVPDSAADLVAVAGAPAEIVSLIRQLLAHFGALTDGGHWGACPQWTPAVAFARRFVY